MNRRGFLGSLMALVVAPKAPQLFHKDLVALRSVPPVSVPDFGLGWTVPQSVLEFQPPVTTITTTTISNCTVGNTVYVRLPQRRMDGPTPMMEYVSLTK